MERHLGQGNLPGTVQETASSASDRCRIHPSVERRSMLGANWKQAQIALLSPVTLESTSSGRITSARDQEQKRSWAATPKQRWSTDCDTPPAQSQFEVKGWADPAVLDNSLIPIFPG